MNNDLRKFHFIWISDPGSPQKKREHEHLFKSYRFFKQKKNLFSFFFFRLFILLKLDEPFRNKGSVREIFFLIDRGKYD